MNRIQQVFENKRAFIPLITAGGPDPFVAKALVPVIVKIGADLIELGVPFSDPAAEGIVIQEAGLRALVSRTTTDKISDTVRRVRQKTDVPLAFMTYINPVLAYGVDKFMKDVADCGIDALIVPDMPFEEREKLLSACKKYDMILMYLVAPTSRERAQAIVGESNGFVYYVLSLGITGVRSEITTNIKEVADTVRQGRDVPRAIGFGTSTLEQAGRMAPQANGVIVGGAIVRMVARYGTDCVEPVCDYVKQMKVAVGV